MVPIILMGQGTQTLDCHPCELVLETAGLLLEPGKMDIFITALEIVHQH